MGVANKPTQTIADRVIARAQDRRRPLMEDDEAIIRVMCDEFVRKQQDRGDWPPKLGEDHVVEFLVAALGNLEFDIPKAGGWALKLHVAAYDKHERATDQCRIARTLEVKREALSPVLPCCADRRSQGHTAPAAGRHPTAARRATDLYRR